MAKKATKKPKTKKRPAKKPIKKARPAVGPGVIGACRIMYRQGAILRMWNPGDPVTQIMRDILEKYLPPLTAGERMALEAKRRLHDELAGSVAVVDTHQKREEERRVTSAELLGAPPATEEPVKAPRRDLVG